MPLGEGGFNRVEVLTIALVSVIVAVVAFVVFDPMAAVAEDRDNIRRSQTVSLLNGLLKYKSMHDDRFPEGIDLKEGTAQVLGTAHTGCDLTCDAVQTEFSCVDLGPFLISGGYIDTIPFDPRMGNDENSGYYVNVLADGKLIVGSCSPERTTVIHVVR